MSTGKKFTQAEMELLKMNPNVVSVTQNQLSYSLAFKKSALEQANQGFTSIKIFTQAGLSVEMLGKPRIYAAMKSFKREAASPKGLSEPRGKSREARMEAFAKEDLTKKQTQTAIKELQDKIVRLEQMVEFLKKTRFPRL